MINEHSDCIKCKSKGHSGPPIIHRALIANSQSDVGLKIGVALEQCGLSVDVVHTGLEAMKLIHKCCPYDIIITELLLEEISGFALVAVANNFQDVVTIGINNGNKSLKLIADEYGIDRLVDPPINFKELCKLSLEILKLTIYTPIMVL